MGSINQLRLRSAFGTTVTVRVLLVFLPYMHTYRRSIRWLLQSMNGFGARLVVELQFLLCAKRGTYCMDGAKLSKRLLYSLYIYTSDRTVTVIVQVWLGTFSFTGVKRRTFIVPLTPCPCLSRPRSSPLVLVSALLQRSFHIILGILDSFLFQSFDYFFSSASSSSSSFPLRYVKPGRDADANARRQLQTSSAIGDFF